MIASEEHFDVPPAKVFEVVANPSWYPEWLVGAKHIRSIDDDWPRAGAAFHHTIGAGPLRIRGSTSVLAIDEAHRLELRAGMGPLGAARVRFTVEADATGTRLVIEEEPERGILRLLWSTPVRPALAAGLWGRNAISLQALRRRVDDPSSPVATDGAS